MAIGLFHTVTALVAACGRHVSRVSKKIRSQASNSRCVSPARIQLGRKQLRLIPFLGKKKQVEGKKRRISSAGEEEEVMVKEEGVWRRTILMGEKCQPIEFSGAIFYDNSGNQLSKLPPRSPMRTSLPNPSFSFPDEKGRKY